MKITKIVSMEAWGLAAVLGTVAGGSCAADLNRAWPLLSSLTATSDMTSVEPPIGSDVVISQSMISPQPSAKYAGVFGACGFFEEGAQPTSAINKFYPGEALSRYFESKGDVIQGPFSIREVVAPKLGTVRNFQLSPFTTPNGRVVNAGYQYEPSQELVDKGGADQFFKGKDQAIYEVEYQGKVYRVIYTFYVVQNVDDLEPKYPNLFNQCNHLELKDTWRISQEGLIENGSSDDLAAWIASSDLMTFVAASSNLILQFEDLPGASVGQTTSEGANVTITLDPAAAGHGWYVDPTPLDNRDDYLPAYQQPQRLAGQGRQRCCSFPTRIPPCLINIPA